jgi:hypothetical protein
MFLNLETFFTFTARYKVLNEIFRNKIFRRGRQFHFTIEPKDNTEDLLQY